MIQDVRRNSISQTQLSFKQRISLDPMYIHPQDRAAFMKAIDEKFGHGLKTLSYKIGEEEHPVDMFIGDYKPAHKGANPTIIIATDCDKKILQKYPDLNIAHKHLHAKTSQIDIPLINDIKMLLRKFGVNSPSILTRVKNEKTAGLVSSKSKDVVLINNPQAQPKANFIESYILNKDSKRYQLSEVKNGSLESFE